MATSKDGETVRLMCVDDALEYQAGDAYDADQESAALNALAPEVIRLRALLEKHRERAVQMGWAGL